MTPHLIVGRGRLSRHLQHHFSLESIAFEQWDRSSTRPLEDVLAGARTVMLLITDDAIEPFLEKYAANDGPIWIHGSGSVTTPLTESAHPLMSFGDELCDRETYRIDPLQEAS